jgi:hypothetical protein
LQVMSIITSDPLAFLTGQGGIVGTPLTEGGAGGAENLDVAQRGAVIGDAIPIVFCRRVSSVGGVLISPAATEARFENSLTNEVTGFYHLVLGEGQMDSIQVRDVFQRSCRVGSFSQTYGRRAGTFVPGNFIVARGGSYVTPECPSYCGTGGRYTGLSTMAYQCTYPDGVDQWNRQVHCFIRGGMYVTRLLDSTLGPSNNVADLLLYLLRNSSRVPEVQIDTASLLAAATFTNVNGFWFNGVIQESTNVRDWIDATLQYFLLRQARVAGKEAVSPLLPTNSNGSIKTTAVSWEFTFTEEHIIPGSFEITYTPLADRKPFCVMALWRQQDDNGIGIIRTAEVRYAGTAEDGPYEQHDLSEFCASENHAVKVGAYILSKRRHVTHRLQIGVKPDAFNPTLTPGDLVRVRLERVASTGASSLHDYLYEVDRIGKSVAGEVRLELTHFPVDANRASVVAQEVNAATGTGILLPTGLSGVTCDINSSSDTSVPADTSLDPSAWDLPDLGAFDFQLGSFGEFGLGDPGVNNPRDGLGGQGSPSAGAAGNLSYSGDPTAPKNGDEITAPVICEGGIVIFYRVDPSVEGGKVIAAQATSTYTLTINDIDKSVYAEIVCPDPSSPTGYGEPIQLGATPIVKEFKGIEGLAVTGTYSPTGSSTMTISGKFTGDGQLSGNDPQCQISRESALVSSTVNITGGLSGLAVKPNPLNASIFICGGYSALTFGHVTANGTYVVGPSVSGGSAGWKSFEGSVTLTSTEADATSASVFDGT